MTKEERNGLINKHYGLVVGIAKSVHYNPVIDLDDLIQWGFLGLMKAIDKYIPQENSSFESYAYKVVKGEIMEQWRNFDELSRRERFKRGKEWHIDSLKENMVVKSKGCIYEEVWRKDINKYLHLQMNKLPVDEKYCIECYYFREWKMKKISNLMGISLGRASQLIQSGIVKLRKYIKVNPL